MLTIGCINNTGVCFVGFKGEIKLSIFFIDFLSFNKLRKVVLFVFFLFFFSFFNSGYFANSNSNDPIITEGITVEGSEDDGTLSNTVIVEDTTSDTSFSISGDSNGDFGYLEIGSSSGYWTYTMTDNLVTQLDEGDVTSDVSKQPP